MFIQTEKLMRLIFAILLLSFSAQTSIAGCAAENAEYRSLEDRDFTILFAKQHHPHAWSTIQATLKTPKQKFDFEFTASNGYGMQYLALLNNDIKDQEDNVVDFYDKNLKELPLPQLGEEAPEFMSAPKLGLWLNYLDGRHQEYLPRGLFKFDHCRK
jgi:hypothetical protein